MSTHAVPQMTSPHDPTLCDPDCKVCRLSMLMEFFDLAVHVYPNTPDTILVFRLPEDAPYSAAERFQRRIAGKFQSKVVLTAGEVPVTEWRRDELLRLLGAGLGLKTLTPEQVLLIKNSLTLALLSPGIDNTTREAFKRVADIFA